MTGADPQTADSAIAAVRAMVQMGIPQRLAVRHVIEAAAEAGLDIGALTENLS